MSKNNISKWIIIAVSCLLIVILGVGITWAVWSSEGNSSKITGLGISFEAQYTSKNLIVELFDTTDELNQNKFIYLSYKDKSATNGVDGAFVFDANYQTEYGGIIPDATTNLTNYSARIIGYIGELGQFEDIEIPTIIRTNINTANPDKIVNVTQIKMQSPQAFPSLHLIKTIKIPSTMKILGVSFSYCKSLEKVIWLGGRPTVVSQNAFRSEKDIIFEEQI